MKKRSAVVLLFVVPALALGACGGDSDKDKITKILEDTGNDPATLCDNATENVLKEVGGEAGCRKSAAGSPKERDIKVSSVDVNGDKATAKTSAEIDGKVNEGSVKLVKESGDWKIDGF